jgi:hypothetical protein
VRDPSKWSHRRVSKSNGPGGETRRVGFHILRAYPILFQIRFWNRAHRFLTHSLMTGLARCAISRSTFHEFRRSAR